MKTIQEDLRLFLRTTGSQQPHQSRNSEIILYFYGLGDSAWPTLQETADRWHVTRERVRQIKKTHFLDRIGRLNVPAVSHFLELLGTAPYWKQSRLVDETLARGLVDDRFSIRGLLNLINDMGLPVSYDIYTPDLQRVTRHSATTLEDCFVMRTSLQKQMRPWLGRARKLSRRYGIAQLNYLSPSSELPEDSLTLLAELIRSGATGWTVDAEGGTWYWFDDTENVLITFGQKVFTVIDACPITELANCFRRALGRRKHEYPFPSDETISAYLRGSRHFRVYGNTVSYSGPTDYRSNLPTVETDLEAYLRPLGEGSTYEEARHELLSRGHTRSNAQQTIFYSPIVRIDKDDGRGSYRYFLIGRSGTKPATDKSREILDLRYVEYRERLMRLDTTDAPMETTRRKEQDALRDWLFSSEDTRRCAICGRSYHIGALVAAHKKKREKCNPAERRDPYIVMPLCVFGCDYLYEDRYLLIQNGVVTKGKELAEGDAAVSYINEVVGRRIEDQWLLGGDSYFRGNGG